MIFYTISVTIACFLDWIIFQLRSILYYFAKFLPENRGGGGLAKSRLFGAMRPPDIFQRVGNVPCLAHLEYHKLIYLFFFF